MNQPGNCSPDFRRGVTAEGQLPSAAASPPFSSFFSAPPVQAEHGAKPGHDGLENRPPVSPRLTHTPALNAFGSVSDLSLSHRSISPTTPASAHPSRMMTARDWARGGLSGTTSPAKEPRSGSISRRDSFAASFASALSAAASPDGGRAPGEGEAPGSPCGPEEMSRRRFRRAVTPRARGLSLTSTNTLTMLPSFVGEAGRGSPPPSPPPLVQSPPPASPFHALQAFQRLPSAQPAEKPIPSSTGFTDGTTQGGESFSRRTSMIWAATGHALDGATCSLTSSPALAPMSPPLSSSPCASVASAALLRYTEQERHFMEENENSFCLDGTSFAGELPVPVGPSASAMHLHASAGAATTIITSARSGSVSRGSQSFSTLFRREASGGFGPASVDGGDRGDYLGGPTPLAWQRSSLSASATSWRMGSAPCTGYVDSAAGLSSASCPSLSLEELTGSASGRASPSALASAATMLAHAAARAAQHEPLTEEDADAVAATLTSDANVVVKRHRLESDLDIISRALSSAPSSQLLDPDTPAPGHGAYDVGCGASLPTPSATGHGGSPAFLGGTLPYPRRRRQVSPSLARPADEEAEDHVRLDASPSQARADGRDAVHHHHSSGRRARSGTRRAGSVPAREDSLPPPPHCDETPQPSQCQHRYLGAGRRRRSSSSGGCGRGAVDEHDQHSADHLATVAIDAPPLCRVVDFCATEAPSTGAVPAMTSSAFTSTPRAGRLARPSSPPCTMAMGTPTTHADATARVPASAVDGAEPPCRLSGLSACSADSDEPQVDAAGLLRHELLNEDADSIVMQEQEARRLRQHFTATSQHARDLLARGDEDSIHLLAELVEEAGRDEAIADTTVDRTPRADMHSGRLLQRRHSEPFTPSSSSTMSPGTTVHVTTPLSPAWQEWCRAAPVTPVSPPSSGFRDVSPPMRERSMAPHEVSRDWRRRPTGH